MMGKTMVGTLALAIGLAGVSACAANGGGEGEDGQGAAATTVCVSGEQVTCACPGGTQGVQRCLEDGTGYADCDCDGTGGGGGSGPCGDGFCDQGDEHCHSCPADCGTCAPCDVAPMCPTTGSMVPPAATEHFADLDVAGMTLLSPDQIQARLAEQVSRGADEMRVIAAALAEPETDEHPFVTRLREIFADHPQQAEAIRFELSRAGMPWPSEYGHVFPAPTSDEKLPEMTPRSDEFPGGTLECGNPYLRVGVSRVTVYEHQDGRANELWIGGDHDEIYCIVQAEAQNGIELRVTPLTPSIENNESHDFSLSTGVFWGQVEQTHPGSDLLVTYDCIENDDTTAYQNLLSAVADGADAIGGSVGDDNGWIFATGAAVANVASAAMGLNGEDHVYNHQQYIELDDQLELTNGYHWTVRQDHGDDGDWELTIKAWGCAQFGLL